MLNKLYFLCVFFFFFVQYFLFQSSFSADLERNDCLEEKYFTYKAKKHSDLKKTIDLTLQNNGILETKFFLFNRRLSFLRTIHLTRCSFGPREAIILAQKTFCPFVTELNLSQNTLGPLGATALSLNTSWIFLKSLNLSENKICSEGIATLAQNTAWKELENLDLSSNKIYNVSALLLNKTWPIAHVNFSFNGIYSQPFLNFIQKTSWPLRFIDLNFNPIRETDMGFLLSHTPLKNLEIVGCYFANCTRLGWIPISSFLPKWHMHDPVGAEYLQKKRSLWMNQIMQPVHFGLWGPYAYERKNTPQMFSVQTLRNKALHQSVLQLVRGVLPITAFHPLPVPVQEEISATPQFQLWAELVMYKNLKSKNPAEEINDSAFYQNFFLKINKKNIEDITRNPKWVREIQEYSKIISQFFH